MQSADENLHSTQGVIGIVSKLLGGGIEEL